MKSGRLDGDGVAASVVVVLILFAAWWTHQRIA